MQELQYGLNGSITAVTANNPRLGRAKLTLLSTAVKGRPEQGVTVTTGRYGTVLGDKGCGSRGTDQRGAWCLFNGPVDMPKESVHGCSQE